MCRPIPCRPDVFPPYSYVPSSERTAACTGGSCFPRRSMIRSHVYDLPIRRPMCQHEFRPSTYHCPEDLEDPRSTGPLRLACVQQAPCSKSRKSVLLSAVLMSCLVGLTHTHRHKKHVEQQAMGLSATLGPTALDPSFHMPMWGMGTFTQHVAWVVRDHLGSIHAYMLHGTAKVPLMMIGCGRARVEENLAFFFFFAWAIKAFTIMSEHGMFSCLARSLPHIVGRL